jgi:hypothetical protein
MSCPPSCKIAQPAGGAGSGTEPVEIGYRPSQFPDRHGKRRHNCEDAAEHLSAIQWEAKLSAARTLRSHRPAACRNATASAGRPYGLRRTLHYECASCLAARAAPQLSARGDRSVVWPHAGGWPVGQSRDRTECRQMALSGDYRRAGIARSGASRPRSD